MRTAAGLPRGRCHAAAWIAVSRTVAALVGAGVLATVSQVAVPDHATARAALHPTPIVVVGVAGLTWTDVTPDTTPAIWGLLDGDAAAGAVTVRTGSSPVCGIGGWLAISAGRAIDSPHVGDICGAPPAISASDPAVGPIAVQGWAALASEQAATTYEAHIGAFGDALAGAGVCATAVGPGAALAVATSAGVVARYAESVSAGAFACPVTVVDAGGTNDLDGSDADVRAVDAMVADVLAMAPSDARVVLASVATPVGGPLGLGVGMSTALGQGRLLTSNATQRPGVVRLLDLPRTVLDAVDVSGDPMLGSSAFMAGPKRPDAVQTRSFLLDLDVVDRVVRTSSGPMINVLGLVALALVILMIALEVRTRTSGTERRGRVMANAVEAVALVAAAASVASFLTPLVRWWRWPEPAPTMWFTLIGFAVVLGLLAYVRRTAPIWWAVGSIAGVTVLVLLLDAVTGTRLQWASPFGISAVLGDRYYGFGNATYAVWAVATLTCAAVAVTPFLRANRTAAALAIVAVIGVIAVGIDVLPTLGADVGGGLALGPAFLLLAATLLGGRLTAGRVVGAVALAFVVVSVVAVADWLRPPASRSHAGQFVQHVLDGDAGDIVARKAGNAVASLTHGPSAWLTVAGLVVVALAVCAPARFRPPALARALDQWPELQGLLIALLVNVVIGSLVNDWGVRVATVQLVVAIPLVVAVVVRAAGRDVPPRDRARAAYPECEEPDVDTGARTGA